jgi:hypothetical protein
MYVSVLLIAVLINLAICLPNGPPICTLIPRHSGLQPQPGNWRDHYEVLSFKINQGRLLDPHNKSGTVSEQPNGIFFIIQPKNVPGGRPREIKGFGLELNPAYNQGQDTVTFPLMNKNRKLKQMQCHNGATFLAHRDPSSKNRVAFFVSNNLDYKEHGVPRFRATILENYSTYYTLEF